MKMNSYVQSELALQNMRRLYVMRNFMVGGLMLMTALASIWLELDLPVVAIGAVLAFMLLLSWVTWMRLKRPAVVGTNELLIQLILDMSALTVLFYYTGGYSNPFVWMYLLPLTVAAVALQWIYTWLITVFAITCYTALIFFYQPLAEAHMHHHHEGDSAFTTHLLGMWLGFVISAGIIAYFVVRIQRNQIEHDRMLAGVREKVLEGERMLALGALATAAAHELGTPLATMSVVAEELQDEVRGQVQLEESLAIILAQISRCKAILTSITASAGRQRAEATHGEPLDTFLKGGISDWQDLRPGTQIDWKLEGSTPSPMIAVDRTIVQALNNLLNNAADASPDRISIAGHWSARELHLTIRDYGAGIPPEVAAVVGTPFFTTKEKSGMGLGLYLARVIFERYGGELLLNNHPDGGTLVTVHLPLTELIITGGP